MPLPTGDEATGRVLGEESTGRVLPEDRPPRATYVGGIGRSAGARISKSVAVMGYKKSNSMRPDEATGKPGSKLEVNKDETTAAADQERLVSAAMAGEVDDVQQLLGRLGVRIDGFVEEGRHAKLTALMAAAGRGRTDVVRVLLNRRESEKIRMGFGIASMNILRVVWALLTSCVTYPKCWLTDLSKNCFRSFAGKLELMWRTLRVGQFLGKSWETSHLFWRHTWPSICEALMHGIHGQRIDACQVLLENNAEFQHVRNSTEEQIFSQICGIRRSDSDKSSLIQGWPMKFCDNSRNSDFWII